jgi:hypothetical protein
MTAASVIGENCALGDLTMPATLQQVFLTLTLIAALLVLAAATMISLKRKTPVPVLMVIGGLVAILLEPVVTYLGHAEHPRIGQAIMFETMGRPTPWHIGLGYMAGFGIFYLIIFSKFGDGTLTRASVWKITLISALCYFLGEAYPVQHALWVYCDYQPLWLWHGTAPVTWNLLNATCMLTSATLMLFAAPYLKGICKLMLIPLAAAGTYMGHFGAGFPMYNAMNSTLPHWAVQLAGACTVALALIIIWLCSIGLTSFEVRTDQKFALEE